MQERRAGLRPGQLVAAQLALVAPLATAGHPAAVAAAVAALAVTCGRVRQRWAYEWLAAATGLLARRLRIGAAGGLACSTAETLHLLAPKTSIVAARVAGQPCEVLVDPFGVTALLEVDGAAPLIVDLVPPADAEVRVVVSARAGIHGDHPPGRDYRRRHAAPAVLARRVVVAVRVVGDDDLTVVADGPLTRAVRHVQQQLGVPTRLLGADEVTSTLADLGARAPLQETWSAVSAGAVHHVCYRGNDRPADPSEWLRAGSAVTMGCGTDGVWVRLTTPGGQPGAGSTEVVPSAGNAQRLDGYHLPALRATLPLPRPGPGAHHRPGDSPAGTEVDQRAPTTATGRIRLSLPVAGVLLGFDQHGAPVIAAFPRHQPVRVVVRSDAALRLLLWQALGAGLPVTVRTDRPARWRSLIAAVGTAALRLAPPGRDAADGGPHEAPTTDEQPIVEVADVGVPAPLARPWSVAVSYLPGLSTATRDVVAAADLVVAAELTDQEATLLRAALGMGSAGVALQPRTGVEHIAVVTRAAVSWLPALCGQGSEHRW